MGALLGVRVGMEEESGPYGEEQGVSSQEAREVWSPVKEEVVVVSP